MTTLVKGEDKVGQVYQLTYMDRGRDVIVGNEIIPLHSAKSYACAKCGHRLLVRWIEVEGTDQTWWLCCPKCDEIVHWVLRYGMAMRRDGTFRPVRLCGSNLKADPGLMAEVGHHAQPFNSVREGEDKLRQEREAHDGVKAALDMIKTLQGEKAHAS